MTGASGHSGPTFTAAPAIATIRSRKRARVSRATNATVRRRTMIRPVPSVSRSVHCPMVSTMVVIATVSSEIVQYYYSTYYIG